MADITITQIVDAIKTTLGAASGVARAQSGTQLTEGIPDTPLLQVYWEAENTSDFSQNDRLTFKAGRRAAHITIHADVYARQRSHIGEDIAAVQTLAEAVRDVLEAQDTEPYFALAGLKAFKWAAQRVTFTYGAVDYGGIRFTLEVWVY